DGTLTITPGITDKNDSNGVRTGDSSNSALYIILIVASLLLLGTIVAFILLQRKKRLGSTAAHGQPSDVYFEKDEDPEDR
ncbi:MAG: hypothetical protein IK095_08790, partial [Oscillospiraceae bacterium]|nr:hypothetical protein [Oscillospiraceae bacterium]